MGTSSSREQRRGGGGSRAAGGRRTARPRSRLRTSGGCAGVNIIGCGGPWQGGLPGSTKHRMVKPCSLGVHPRACGRSLNGTPTTELSVSNHEDRRVRPTSRTVYPPPWMPSRRALSLSIRSFFEVRTSLATLRRGTRTSHTFASVYAFIRGVGEVDR